MEDFVCITGEEVDAVLGDSEVAAASGSMTTSAVEGSTGFQPVVTRSADSADGLVVAPSIIEMLKKPEFRKYTFFILFLYWLYGLLCFLSLPSRYNVVMFVNIFCSVLGNLPVYTVQSHLERLLQMSEHWCDVTGMSEQLAYELHQTIRGTYGMYPCNRFFIFVHFLLSSFIWSSFTFSSSAFFVLC